MKSMFETSSSMGMDYRAGNQSPPIRRSNREESSQETLEHTPRKKGSKGCSTYSRMKQPFEQLQGHATSGPDLRAYKGKSIRVPTAWERTRFYQARHPSKPQSRGYPKSKGISVASSAGAYAFIALSWTFYMNFDAGKTPGPSSHCQRQQFRRK